MTAAFAEHNGLGTDLNVMLGSDISHFDTPDMDRVVPNARRLVDKGLLTDAQLRALLCDNAAHLFTHADPDFFAGTAVADYVRLSLGCAPGDGSGKRTVAPPSTTSI